jgi:hypothetical protein
MMAELAEPAELAESVESVEPVEVVEPAERCPSGGWCLPLPWGSPQPRHRLFGAGFSSEVVNV